MSAVIQSFSSKALAPGGSAVITQPAGLAVGDLMVAIAYGGQDSLPGVSWVFSAPAGWTTGIGGGAQNNFSGKYEAAQSYYKIATLADVGAPNFTFSLNTTTNGFGGVIYRITGFDASSPIDATTAGTNNNNSPATHYSFSLSLQPTYPSLMLALGFANAPGGSVSNIAVSPNQPTWNTDLNDTIGGSIAVILANATRSAVSQITGGSFDNGSSNTGAMLVIAIKSPPWQISVSETTNVTDFFTPGAYRIIVSDTTVISESFSSGTIADENAVVNVSDYKWLTGTLKTAQAGPGFRPYFTCKIVDDTIQPNAIISPPGVPLNGSSVIAPDGYALSVGDDGTGKLQFWKQADASTGWGSPSHQLAATYRNDLNASIAVSDYINGTYVIDVYYYINNAGALNIVHQRSVDGGTTWSSAITVNDIVVANATTDNMYLSAGTPVLLSNGNVNGVVFYIKKTISHGSVSEYQILYQYYSGSGATFNAAVAWNNTANSNDWTIISVDNFYDNGAYYIVFAGYQNFVETVPNANYGIYTTKLSRITSTSLTDTWSLTTQIFAALSNTSSNQNVFTYPTLNKFGNTFYLLFRATVVTSVSLSSTTGQTSNVVTQTYYYLAQSTDGVNYSYPAPLVFTDGTIFSSTKAYDFLIQNSYAYTIGNGVLWQFVINSIVADVTNSLINYSISESYGSAFQIVLTIANMNSQWVGPSPTKTGYLALAKNRKIYLEQGYYDADGVAQYAPKNVFFIDDVKQVVDANSNVVNISGRDAIKNLKVLSTKYAYNFTGIVGYIDIFPGNTFSNWTPLSGSWSESGGMMTNATLAGGEILLGNYGTTTESSILTCLMVCTRHDANAVSYIYPIYIDSNNWLKFSFIGNGGGTQVSFSFDISVNGFVINLKNGNMPTNEVTQTYPVLIRKFGYTFFDVVIGSPFSTRNMPGSFDPTAYIGTDPNYPVAISLSSIDIATYFDSTHQVLNGVIGLGSANHFSANFSYLKYLQFGNSQSIQEIMQKIGSLAGVTRFNNSTLYKDQNFIGTDWNGSYLLSGQGMKILPSTTVMQKNNTFMNGELQVQAYVTPTNPSADYSLNLIVEADSATALTDYYRVEFYYNASAGGNAKLKAGVYIDLPTETLLVQSNILNYQVIGGGSNTGSNALPFDITKQHTYKVVVIDHYFYLFIDDLMVLMWQDNNTQETLSGFSNGYWGFKTDSNSTMYIQKVFSNMMWNQLTNVALNPGDDASATLQGLLDMVRGFTFTDLMGRLTALTLNSVASPNYTYDDLLYSQEVDNSDKEYVNQVTVYGNGVSATYQDTASISSTGKIRDLVISDYKITTYQDAYDRAKNELIDARKFNSQNTPAYPLNVGAEVFDIITITNTGENSTGINGTYREYNQVTTNDGSRGRYSIKIETGTP